MVANEIAANQKRDHSNIYKLGCCATSAHYLL